MQQGAFTGYTTKGDGRRLGRITPSGGADVSFAESELVGASLADLKHGDQVSYDYGGTGWATRVRLASQT